MGAAVELDAAGWQRVHDELVRIGRRRRGLDYEEGRWLLMAEAENLHRRFGYARFSEYVSNVLGHGPHETAERLRVARALEKLPLTSGALTSGTMAWSAARELTRVLTPETENEWLQACNGLRVHHVQQLVAGLAPGARPGDPRSEALRRQTLRIEVTGATLATYREAVAKIQREAGGTLDEDAVLLEMARRVLGGPREEGRASYQIAVAMCPRCESAWQQSGGSVVEVSGEVAAMARCDAQDIGVVDASHVGRLEKATQTIPPATRRMVLRRDRGCCVVPGCKNALFVDVHHLRWRQDGGDHDPDNLVVLCGPHHRIVHEGAILIRGRPSSGLSVVRADGVPYEHQVWPS